MLKTVYFIVNSDTGKLKGHAIYSDDDDFRSKIRQACILLGFGENLEIIIDDVPVE